MTDRTSLALLIEISKSERDAQLSHFDSLDTKAGLVLGFAGVLIALGGAPGSVLGLGSIILAALAAAMAVASFWPRNSRRSTRYAWVTTRSVNWHSRSSQC